jgi:RNA polymerase sigma-54 factor
MYWGDNRRKNSPKMKNVFTRPDISITYMNNDPNKPLIVEVFLPYRGTLRVNPAIKKASKNIDDAEKKELWKTDIENASLLVKCLQQRNNTMMKLMQKLVSCQKTYITRGEKYLKPITRAQFAQELDVHESTISRAVSNKTVELPNKKIVPLSRFFERNLSARVILREIIENETQPMSDAVLVEKLAEEGVHIKRRTVAKYRMMEGILPAHLRKREKLSDR